MRARGAGVMVLGWLMVVAGACSSGSESGTASTAPSTTAAVATSSPATSVSPSSTTSAAPVPAAGAQGSPLEFCKGLVQLFKDNPSGPVAANPGEPLFPAKVVDALVRLADTAPADVRPRMVAWRDAVLDLKDARWGSDDDEQALAKATSSPGFLDATVYVAQTYFPKVCVPALTAAGIQPPSAG